MSENVFKVRSHAERTMRGDLNNPSALRPFDSVITKNVREDNVNKSGVITKRSVLKTFDLRDNMRGLKPSDFMIDNIIAVGAVDSLKNCQLSLGNIGELSDTMEGVINNVISSVDEAENKSEK